MPCTVRWKIDNGLSVSQVGKQESIVWLVRFMRCIRSWLAYIYRWRPVPYFPDMSWTLSKPEVRYFSGELWIFPNIDRKASGGDFAPTHHSASERRIGRWVTTPEWLKPTYAPLGWQMLQFRDPGHKNPSHASWRCDRMSDSMAIFRQACSAEVTDRIRNQVLVNR